MTIEGLAPAQGDGKRKIASVSSSITGDGTIDTELDSIDQAVATVKDSSTSLPTHVASITSIDGGSVDVVVTEQASSANSIATSSQTVTVIAVGET